MTHSLYLLKAETICAMKVESSNMSYRSCEGISSILMLYSIVQFLSLKLSRSYVISDGIYDPFFRKANLWYLKQETSETTTVQVLKQKDFTLMFGHSEGTKVAAAMVEQLEGNGVNPSYILTLSSDVHMLVRSYSEQ